MSHSERVKDNKRIQAAKDAANPDKAEKQRKYQENLRKNPAVIARKEAIKQGRYPKYGKDISFANIARKNQDMVDTQKKGYHVNMPREVYDESYINELKSRTMLDYIDKASDSARQLLDKSKKSSIAQGAGQHASRLLKMDRRERGIELAKQKILRRQGSEKKAGSEKPENKRNTMRGASPDSTQYFSQEEFVSEDDMKGMSVKSGHKRPTKSGAGMTAKGVAAYRRRNPGSKLQTAVTGKVKKGSKDAKRRKSYCARSAGQMKKFPKAAKDPNSRLRQARRRWKC